MPTTAAYVDPDAGPCHHGPTPGNGSKPSLPGRINFRKMVLSSHFEQARIFFVPPAISDLLSSVINLTSRRGVPILLCSSARLQYWAIATAPCYYRSPQAILLHLFSKDNN